MSLELKISNPKGAYWTGGWRDFDVEGIFDDQQREETEEICQAIDEVLLGLLEEAYQKAFNEGRLYVELAAMTGYNPDNFKKIEGKKRYVLERREPKVPYFPGWETFVEREMGIYTYFEGALESFGWDKHDKYYEGGFEYYYGNPSIPERYPKGVRRVRLAGSSLRIDTHTLKNYEELLKRKMQDGRFSERLKKEIGKRCKEPVLLKVVY